MSNLILDPEVISKLRKATGPCWLRDADGNLIGYFHPGKPEPPKVLEEGQTPELSDEEYERRVAEGGGRTWQEIKSDLERLS